MRAYALLALAGLVLAGCIGQPVQTAANDPLPTAAPDPVEVVAVVDPAGGQGEPSLGVAPDGTLYTNGVGDPDAFFDSGGAYQSKDGGRTWQKLGTPTAPFPNFDPDLAVDVDGTIWFDTLWIGCTATAVSRDAGKTWVTNPLACVPPAGDRQYVIPTKGGTAYLYSHNLPTFYQMAVKTTDYGQTWLPTGPVETPDHFLLLNGGTGWGGGGFWNAKTGSVFLTWTWNEGLSGGSMPGFAVTRDEGLTWTLGTVPNAGGQSVGLGLVVGAADDAGNVYLAWAESKGDDPRSANMSVWMVASKDDGKTWGKPVRVNAGNQSVVFPAIAAGPDGKVAIAYYEADRPGYPSNLPGEASWNVTLATTADATAESPAWSHLRLTNESVRHGAVCPDGTGCTGNRQFLDYFSVKRLPDGRVASVFTSTDAVKDKTVNVFAATREPLLG